MPKKPNRMDATETDSDRLAHLATSGAVASISGCGLRESKQPVPDKSGVGSS